MPRAFNAHTDFCAHRCASTLHHLFGRPWRTTLILVILCISFTEGYAFRSASTCRGLDRRTKPLSCSSWRKSEKVTVPVMLRGNSINSIGRLSGWMRHIQFGVEMLLPWLRVPDTRSGKIKYLDTCLALVSEDAMAAWLERQANVDLSLWGKGKAKAVRDLLKEVLSGESELRSDGTRVVRVAKVRIVDDDFELINTLQVLSNGAVKERNRELSEKFRSDETPAQAAARGIREELGPALGAAASIRILDALAGGAPAHAGGAEVWEEEEWSSSYPGLRCVYRLHRVDAQVEGLCVASTGPSFVTAEAAASDGHADKLHVWEWRRRRPADAAVAPAPAPAAARAPPLPQQQRGGGGGGEAYGQLAAERLLAPDLRVFSY